MKEYIDISASLHTNSLTLFVGTGFSKYITNGKAPSWIELMAQITNKIDKKSVLLNQLFNVNKDGEVKDTVYDLTIIAQILEAEYRRNKKDIKNAVAEIINDTVNEKTIDKAKLSELQEFFKKYPSINIITTNYDTIFSDYILPNSSRVFVEGGPIPRLNSHQNIFHIHGCITKPSSIILTLNDYFNFQNSQNYFARKFFTLLQETTVCVLGYSLGDFNLNTILSEVNNNKTTSFRKSDLYYISRTEVPEIISSFYSFTYGIKTLELTEVNEFFNQIEAGLAPNGQWLIIKDFASKAAENVARLAALFHLFENKEGDIQAEHLANAVEIISWHLHETKRLLSAEVTQTPFQDAQKLLDWLVSRGLSETTTRDIQRLSPLRDKARMKKAIDVLLEHKLLREAPRDSKTAMEINPHCFA